MAQTITRDDRFLADVEYLFIQLLWFKKMNLDIDQTDSKKNGHL